MEVDHSMLMRQVPRGRVTMKTVCSISRETFHEKAEPIKVTIDFGNDKRVVYDVPPGDFDSGSMGYSVAGRYDFPIAGGTPKCMLSFNLTLIGSKKL